MLRTVTLLLAFVCVIGSTAPAARTTSSRGADIAFDPRTRTVSVTFSVLDPNGTFVPNLRPQNFAVYEDGVRQRNATIDVEHAAVTMAVLLEGGGRYQQLNKILGTEVPYVGRAVLDVLGKDDRVAVFGYASDVRTLADFEPPHPELELLFDRLPVPGFSEANLHDALIHVIERTQPAPGRRAVLVISTGLDTFSRATFDEVLTAAQRAGTPVYSIGLAGFVKRTVIDTSGPLAKVDWKAANDRLTALARISGGRTYLRDNHLEIAPIYDDLMEHLRVRYVITYVSPNDASGGPPRTVRVEVVNPPTGAPVRAVGTTGGTRATPARISVQGTYAP